ncbi:hypothetical protein [Cronobacter muytjensii]|uniref:hypothetical protein n=1 Tax=Cronobacter muytjensii TaxID=413501 RepID=UPI0015882992|nr:hypothetical protein [Cronobacter muytjensii]NUW61507.1 hypothetical protein [Cronobacter muytjensii]
MKLLKDFLLALFKTKSKKQAEVFLEAGNNPKQINQVSTVENKTNPKFVASQKQLNQLLIIWNSLGALSETLNPNLNLWHSGTIGSKDMINNSELLWCTRDENSKESYNEAAKLDAPHIDKLPCLTHFQTVRELKMADFNCMSLGEFTRNFCDYSHWKMKGVLREWCLQNGFDGAVKTNGGIDEVVLCKPGDDLLIINVIHL